MINNNENTASVYIDKNKKNINSVVVIPALNPVSSLTNFVMELIKRGIPQVIVVNDGSDSSFDDVFRKLKNVKGCIVLVHEVNRGKGRALKTAFSYYLKHFAYYDGVVTADADGQHRTEDILKISRRLSTNENSLILGVRNFKEENVPKRSYMGNMVTSRIFQLLYGYYLNDTQTGLRGIPSGELAWMTQMKGERYEFEINMLIKARRRNIKFLTVPITTLYFDNNSGSHFSTVKDSIPIFLCLISGLLQYSGATIVSGVLDVSSFFILNTYIFSGFPAHTRIFISTLFARIISSICNFFINRKIIFIDKGSVSTSSTRYYMLVIFQIMISYGLVYGFSCFWKVNESIIKILVDIILGFGSYQTQMRWVFKNDEDNINISYNYRSIQGDKDGKDN